MQVSRDTECDTNTRIEVLKRHAAQQDVHIAAKPHRGARGRKCTFLGGEIDSERENSLARDTALYGLAASQPRSLAAFCGFAQRCPPAASCGCVASAAAYWPWGFGDVLNARPCGTTDSHCIFNPHCRHGRFCAHSMRVLAQVAGCWEAWCMLYTIWPFYLHSPPQILVQLALKAGDS